MNAFCTNARIRTSFFNSTTTNQAITTHPAISLMIITLNQYFLIPDS